MKYPRKNLIYPKQLYISQSNQIKFENPKSSLPLKRFIVHFLTTLKPRKTKSQIKAHLAYLDSPYFYIYKPSPHILRQHRVLRNLRKNEITFITKPDKWNEVVILDGKLFDNVIQEIISDTSKFGKLNENPTLKHQTSLQCF